MHRDHQAIVNLFGGHAPLCLSFESNSDDDYTVRHLKQRINALTNVDVADQSFSTMGGRPLTDDHVMFENDSSSPVIFNMSLRLLGGKGGFGSMLRAQGGRMNAQKTTNFEACRDLQGRRIRTVNDSKKLQEELDALPEREKEKREKLQKKIDEGLRGIEQKKYRFDDTQFLEDREQMVDSVKSAVGSLFKQQQQKKKPVTAAAAAVSVSMFDDDDDEDEEEDDEEDEQVDADTEEPPQKKQKQEEETTSTTAAKDGKGKGKAPASSSGSSNKKTSSGDADSEDEDEEDSKKILSDFLESNYEEYDSEDDEDFEEGEESSEEEEEEEEEDFEAEEGDDDNTPQKVSSGSSSAAADKGKGKQTGTKRKEREE